MEQHNWIAFAPLTNQQSAATAFENSFAIKFVPHALAVVKDMTQVRLTSSFSLDMTDI